MNFKLGLIGSLIFFLVVKPSLLISQVILPQTVSDGMVLQRNTKVNIWGKASPLEKVTIRFKNNIYSTITGADGRCGKAQRAGA